MKIYYCLVLMFLFYFVGTIKAQQLASSSSNEDVQSVQSGIFPASTNMLRGGQEKTATGTLKVLVIFVRYLDDTQNTSTWPDYNVLPPWAQTFVDPNIPANNIFTPLNLSDFFDRSSGGDGNGHLGQFHVIGDVVYVTTKHDQSYYTYDPSTGKSGDTRVFEEVLQTLDDPNGPYNINFKQYDNWQFMRGDTLFNHYYLPGVGDGIADQIWFINRGYSRDGVSAEKTLAQTNFPTNDGVTINSTSGSRIFLGERNITTPQAVGGPAHEYCHYLFGGGQVSGHFDGRVYNNYGNEGRINMYALMCAVNAGYMSCYEEYRLRWLNPTIITSNTNNIVLGDSHVNDQAIIIPLRYDPSTGLLKEYYFLENYETRNEYAGANPFVQSSIFNHTLTHGLLVYHIINEDDSIATNSNISIVNADGRYSWKLVQGASTPYDRSDDLIGKDIPTYHRDFDYRDNITINVGGVVTYNDYACLIHHNSTDPDGWRYNSDDFLGTDKDFYNTDFNNVFSEYSNPAAYLGDDITATNVGFQILNFNSQTKQFTLSIQLDKSGVLSLAPSKPQDLETSVTSDGHLSIKWFPNSEPNLNSYKIYKAITSGSDPSSYSYVATVPSNQTNWTDPVINTTNGFSKVFYKVSALNSSSQESVQSYYAFMNCLNGQITSNTDLSSLTIINSTVTVASGATLTINPGTNLNFASGTSLTVNGTLVANGTSTDSITFTSSNGSWGGVTLSGSGADGSSIQYANFQLYGSGVTVSSASDVNIEHCTITDGGDGAIRYDNSSGYIDNNTISSSESYANAVVFENSANINCYNNTIVRSNHDKNNIGIVCSSGVRGNIFQNDIDYFSIGIDIVHSSSPDFYNRNPVLGRNNRITNCSYGVMVYDNSYPIVGLNTTNYEGNSIHNNTVDIALNTQYSTTSNLDAELVYWNNGNPANAIFQFGNGSTISDDAYLTSDPWSSYPLPNIMKTPATPVHQTPNILANISSNNEMGTSHTIAASNTGANSHVSIDSILIGINLRHQDNYKAAANYFLSYLAAHPGNQRAYAELYNCADSSTISIL